MQKMIAAMTPGTQPASVSTVVSTIGPHPLSSTAAGGKSRQTMTRSRLMVCARERAATLSSAAARCRVARVIAGVAQR